MNDDKQNDDGLYQPVYRADEPVADQPDVPVEAETLPVNAGQLPEVNVGAVRGSGAGAGNGDAEDNPAGPE